MGSVILVWAVGPLISNVRHDNFDAFELCPGDHPLQAIRVPVVVMTESHRAISGTG